MAAAGQERLRLAGVSKSFPAAGGPVPVLHEVSLTLHAGEFGVITGPSGSGKTTLLMLAGLLLAPDSGGVWLDGVATAALPDAARAEIRKHDIGMVFQKFCLMPHRSALDNVLFRFRYVGGDTHAARDQARDALARVGLAAKAGQAARLLSAGEMQRVAIARALARPAKILLADEPTGNLDPDSAAQVMELFRTVNRAGMAILLVTHNHDWIAHGTAHWTMHNGRLQRQ